MTSATTESDLATGDRLAKRNALILASATAIGGAAAPIAISLGGLTGYYLLGDDKSLATLPVTGFVLGTALTTIPAALLARKVGRRPAYMFATTMTMVAGALAAYSVIQGFFWLFCLGMMLSGGANAFTQQYRFAAADTASPALRPKVISWVLIGGVFTGIIGPQTAIFTKDLFDPIPFAGAFTAQIGLGILAFMILSFVAIPKPVISPTGKSGRPLFQIIGKPKFIVAVACAIISYALMSLVMTAAPLAMVACGLSQSDAALGIQWHVIAMFAPSFFTGHLISRFGAEKVVAFGLFILMACAAVALSGLNLANFWIALVLLGIGWNFGFIGGTTMVTATYEPEEQSKVQAANDFLVFGFVAMASLMSGALLNAFGWNTVLILVFPFSIFCLGLIGWQHLSNRAQES